MAKKKKKDDAKPADNGQSPAEGGLTICRNKHWRYISAYHGNWLSLPIEVLEFVALRNWNRPSPQPIEPGVLFDVLRIRKLVEQAAEDAVRAANGIVQPSKKGSSRDYTSLIGDPGGQLSKHRILKIRQKACKSLAEAFNTDEIAASVASMAATSTLEDVAQHVLRHDSHDLAATYVHFFHEKIPSRAMKQHTPLIPLDNMLARLPHEAQLPVLRTRAGVKAYKGDYGSAVADYNVALRILQDVHRAHKPSTQELELASKLREERALATSKRAPTIKDEDRPDGLELQLLFNRGSTYLNWALDGIDEALDGLHDVQCSQNTAVLSATKLTVQQHHLDARKHVKTNAKRALKDLLAFLSKIEYTPGIPDSARRQCATAAQSQNVSTGQAATPPVTIYTASMLFSEKPPVDLLSLHGGDLIDSHTARKEGRAPSIGKESVTFHPLLIETLHLLLIAHALLQTSTTELRRHALTTIRLSTLASGDTIFQLARSPARSDWAEILHRANDWLGLGVSWHDLMQPTQVSHGPSADAAKSRALLEANHETDAASVEEVDQEQTDAAHESIINVLSDDRVVDEQTFHQAFLASQQRRECDDASLARSHGASSTSSPADQLTIAESQPFTQDRSKGTPAANLMASKGDQRLDPILTLRVQVVSRWIKEAPLSLGGSNKKRRAAHKKKQGAGDGASTLADSVTSLTLSNGDDEIDPKTNDQ